MDIPGVIREVAGLSTVTALQEPEPHRSRAWLRTALKLLGLLVLMAIVGAGSAFFVFEWRIQSEQAATSSQVAALQQDFENTRAALQTRQTELEAQVKRVEQATADASLLLEQEGELTGLAARLQEIDSLKLELSKARAELDEKLKAMEQSVAEQVAQQGQETAQALSVELRWKNLVVKAQGEVLLAQVHWAEGNRGLARDELSIAITSLQQARDAAPEAIRERIDPVLDLADQARSNLILERSSARDSLNLLWHRASDLLAER